MQKTILFALLLGMVIGAVIGVYAYVLLWYGSLGEGEGTVEQFTASVTTFHIDLGTIKPGQIATGTDSFSVTSETNSILHVMINTSALQDTFLQSWTVTLTYPGGSDQITSSNPEKVVLINIPGGSDPTTIEVQIEVQATDEVYGSAQVVIPLEGELTYG